PWGGGGRNGGPGDNGERNPWGSGDRGGRGGGGGGGGGQPPVPDIDEIVRKGQEQLKILMGGGRKGGGGRGGSGGGGGNLGARGFGLIALVAVGLWLMMSFYSVRPEEQSVELTFGECRGDCIGQPGLNFAPWPIVTRDIVTVSRENTVEIGTGTVRGASDGLMLTGEIGRASCRERGEDAGGARRVKTQSTTKRE